MKKRWIPVSIAAVLVALVFIGQAQAANPIPVGDGPYAVLANPIAHEVYVPNWFSDTVSIIDSVSDEVTATVDVGTPGRIAVPVAVAHNPNTDRLYVVNFWLGQIKVIRLDTRQVEATMSVGSSHGPPKAIVVNPMTDLIYATNLGSSGTYGGFGFVHVIEGDPLDPRFNQVTTSFPVGRYPRSAALNTTLNRLYVANTGSNTVSVIDVDPSSETSHQVKATIPVGSEPYAISVNHSTAKVYVTNRLTNNVSVIDGTIDSVVATVSTGTYPRALDINPERNLIYVANYNSNNVTVIDGVSDTVATTVPTGIKPYAVASIRTLTGNTYVANYGSSGTSGTVTAIDPSFATSETTAGRGPSALSIDTLLAKPKVYAANWGSNDVSVIDPDTGASSLVSTIDRFPGDMTLEENPVITGTSDSLATPYPGRIMKVYYLLDASNAKWQEARITQGWGTPSATWEAQIVGPLAPGGHTVRVVALDMTGATVFCANGESAGSPSTGEVASYAFTYGIETNRPPQVGPIGDRSAQEGDAVSLDATFTDAGKDDTHTARIDWGDGTIEAGAIQESGGSGTVSGSHAYSDNGIYTVTVTVTDDDGGVGTDTLTVTVNNAAPVITHFDPGSDPFEGQVASVLANFTDLGTDDTHTATIDWGDGTPDSFFDVAVSPLAGSHTYSDNGTYAVTVTVTDDDGGVGTDTLQITVNNVPPTANAGADQTVVWGDEVIFQGSYTDPGTLDTVTASWSFGDGGSAKELTATHAYQNPGAYTATLKVTDDDGGTGTDEAQVTVEARPTIITYEGNVSGEYSDAASLKATLADDRGIPLVDKPVTFALGSQQVEATTNLEGQATAELKLDQLAGTKSLAASFDGDTHYLPATTLGGFEVNKEATSLTYNGDAITQRYQTATLKAQLSETDASVGELLGKTVVFTITDGVNTQSISAPTDSSGLATTTVQITNPPGMYRVTGTFAGDDHYLGSSSAEVPYVIWEPIAGLNVNGGGWLLKEGQKTNFGFTAKYVDSSGTPRGQLEVMDRASGQNIHSEGFDWLIVTTDSKAILQGSASINGQDGHTFRLIISDVATPGKGQDTFELQLGGLPFISGVLDGGNIVIH